MLGAAFAALLLFAAYRDSNAKEISNLICAVICITAIIRILWGGLPPDSAIGGLLVAGLPLFMNQQIKKGSVGGGDIKLSAAAGMFLGIEAATAMLIMSCLAFYSISYVLQRKGKIKAGTASAFAPYIAAGGIVAFSLMLLKMGG